jgi:hypothetical protein
MMMLTASSYRTGYAVLVEGFIEVYHNRDKDIDICPGCYPKLSSTVVNLLQPLRPLYSWSERGRNRCDVYCDVCKNSLETKTSIAIMLRSSTPMRLEDIARACQGFPWTENKERFVSTLRADRFTFEEAETLATLLKIPVDTTLGTSTVMATPVPTPQPARNEAIPMVTRMRVPSSFRGSK